MAHEEGNNAVTPVVKDLAELVAQCRKHPEAVVDLARFVSDIIARRKRLYQYCFARGSSRFLPPTCNI